MKSLFCIILILLFNTSFLAQTKIDSLRNVFENTSKTDSIRFNAGTDLLYSQLGINLEDAKVTGNKLIQLAIKANNKLWLAQANRYTGTANAINGEFVKANTYFFKSFNILSSLDHKKELTTTLNNIGTVFYELGNYTQAQDYLLRSLKLAEELSYEDLASRALNNLGNVHQDLRNNNEALDYYQRSLSLKEKLGQKHRLPAAYNNLGLAYSNLKDSRQAIKSLEKSAKLAKELNDKRSESRAYSNIGIQYSKQKKYDQALTYFNKSILIKTKIKDNDGLASAFLYRGQNYLAMKDFNSAKTDCLLSLEMTGKSGALNLQKEGCDCVSKSFEGIGNYRSAFLYNQKFIILKDSIFNKEKTKEITRNEMKYEFEKEQLADSIAFQKQQTAQKVTFQKNLNKQHRKFYITLIASIIAISLLLFTYVKHKQNLKLKTSELEFKQKDLTNLAVNISNNHEWAESLAQRLDNLKAATGRKRAKELEDLETEIKNKIWVNNTSDKFYQQIDELGSSFYNKLTSQFDGLTKTDIRLCSLIKLNLNTKQIATLQNINPSSVKMSRNRLRKKLNLSPDEDLTGFLRSL
ncbi:tetratricopeptide repeat protein [Seonamhaeicola marinus]|uniref:Tetratricopeptide repeat protein n=1 Tax=Seonamhaeicola marinus TaxID=1912246 RepID=A0A5D0I6F5_9FLAO|nr:tetratricopeptide repeat protein [Seonamhaeicola marinus]TYA78461.1 tetratricopeptide repeat protein [Seonamhaeicola marinus]